MRQTRIDPTVALLVSLLLGFIVTWIPDVGEQWAAAMLLGVDSFSRPWSLLGHAWVLSPQGLIWHLIGALWLFRVGKDVTALTNPRTMLTLFFGFVLLFGLFFVLGCQAVGSAMYAGPFAAVAALSIYWAGRSPEAAMNFWGVMVIKLKWYAVAIAALVFFNVGTGAPLLGVFALVPMAAAWVLGRKQWALPSAGVIAAGKQKKKEQAEFHAYQDAVREREREREEKERLRQLLERSLDDDSDSASR